MSEAKAGDPGSALAAISMADMMAGCASACSRHVPRNHVPMAAAYVAHSLLRVLELAQALPPGELAAAAFAGSIAVKEHFADSGSTYQDSGLELLDDEVFVFLKSCMDDASPDEDSEADGGIWDQAEELRWVLLGQSAEIVFRPVALAAGWRDTPGSAA